MLCCKDEDMKNILVVEIKVKTTMIRLMNFYGPQENAQSEIKEDFFLSLQTKIQSAKLTGNLLCIHMDANSKLGNIIIKNDPHPMSTNWKTPKDSIAN
jgi:hypothetical protein